MAIYALGDLVPTIADDAYVHPDAVVIGNVTLGAGVSVWPQAVLRGDYGRIEIGAHTNIQDGSVLHCTSIDGTVLGADCVVGHNAHIEGAEIGDGTLIASGSIVLNGSKIGAGSIIAAGALVSARAVIPARSMALGIPARVREGYQVPADHLALNTQLYMANAAHYRVALRRLD